MTRILLVLALLIPLPQALACRCKIDSFEQAYDRASAVFVGKVISIDPAPTGRAHVFTATLRVKQAWKGIHGNTVHVNINTGMSGSACGYLFLKNHEYLVYAVGNKTLYTGVCNRTTPIESAGADIDKLKARKK